MSKSKLGLTKRNPFLARLLRAAEQHGLDSEPDHEVGDLQDLTRALWAAMTPAQRQAFAGRADWRDFIEQWGGS